MKVAHVEASAVLRAIEDGLGEDQGDRVDGREEIGLARVLCRDEELPADQLREVASEFVALGGVERCGRPLDGSRERRLHARAQPGAVPCGADEARDVREGSIVHVSLDARRAREQRATVAVRAVRREVDGAALLRSLVLPCHPRGQGAFEERERRGDARYDVPEPICQARRSVSPSAWQGPHDHASPTITCAPPRSACIPVPVNDSRLRATAPGRGSRASAAQVWAVRIPAAALIALSCWLWCPNINLLPSAANVPARGRPGVSKRSCSVSVSASRGSTRSLDSATTHTYPSRLRPQRAGAIRAAIG